MSYIDDVFCEGGILARHFDAYEMREGQVQLARAIDAAFERGSHILAEGPTGTGKALAYSVPAIFHASQKNRRILIVTANIALQEQLCYKDLPLLVDLLPWEFSYELVKGKSNYLCLDRLAQETSGASLDLPGFDDGDDRYRELLAWACETSTGDVSDLGFQPSRALWSRFSVTSHRCKAGDCRYRDECFAYMARERAESADIVVTNYHLLFVHLLVREATSLDLILPPFDLVVCDEGHRAPDIARDFFGYRVMPRNLRWVARRLRGIGQRELAGYLAMEGEKFFGSLAAYRESNAYKARIKQPGAVDSAPVIEFLRRAEWASKHAMAACEEPKKR